MKAKKVLIVGSTHGIGGATTRQFLSEGKEVFGCSSTLDAHVDSLCRSYPNYHHMRVDISREDEVREMLAWCCQENVIDVAINCAGTGIAPQPIDCFESDCVRRVVDVNLMGTAYCMKYELMHMKASGGIIINCSSIAALEAGTGADWSYAASKAGMDALMREAAHSPEFGSIYFVNLRLGYIQTRMTAADDIQKVLSKTRYHKIGQPREVANLVSQIASNPQYGIMKEFEMIGGGYFEE